MGHKPSERVLQAWLTDPRFRIRQGRPKPLMFRGKGLSFERLVKEFGGDVSPRAVLEELLRSRAVSRVEERLVLQASRIPILRSGLGALAELLPVLMDGLRIVSRQPPSSIDSALFRISLHASSTAELALIRQRCSSAIESYLRGLKESLAHELTLPVRKRSSRHALAVTVMLTDTGISES